jgi:hypothetical protein
VETSPSGLRAVVWYATTIGSRPRTPRTVTKIRSSCRHCSRCVFAAIRFGVQNGTHASGGTADLCDPSSESRSRPVVLPGLYRADIYVEVDFSKRSERVLANERLPQEANPLGLVVNHSLLAGESADTAQRQL